MGCPCSASSISISGALPYSIPSAAVPTCAQVVATANKPRLMKMQVWVRKARGRRICAPFVLQYGRAPIKTRGLKITPWSHMEGLPRKHLGRCIEATWGTAARAARSSARHDCNGAHALGG